MKFKTLISSSLAIGFLFNTALPSIANTLFDDTRYETLEGEYITIEDSTEGELIEIEVFGNTVQDENNLEDIQSVGDLYVDENGNPILDNQGKEQYKLNILSSSIPASSISYEEFSNIIPINQQGYTAFYVKDLEYVTVKLNDEPILNPDANSQFRVYDKYISLGEEVKLTPISGLEDYVAFFNWSGVSVGNGKEYIFNALELGQLELSIKVKGKPLIHKNLSGQSTASETTILLPTQLQKVGDVADKLYWDNEKGRYVIEKNIEKINLKDLPWELYTYQQSLRPNTSHFVAYITQRKDLGTCITTYEKLSHRSDDNEEEGLYYQAAWNLTRVFINISNGKLNSISVEDFLDVLGDNHYIYIDYPNPKLIETNITSKLKIPTYDSKTYVFVNTDNEISPTLKVTVDRIVSRAMKAIEVAKANPTVENISIARMWTNLIGESIKKDELQDEINSITKIVDLEIEKKTATANVDLYIKSNNSLTMSLSTNSVAFENYSGVEDLEMLDVVNITVNSSLPYSLNAYMPSIISNADGSNTMDANILNIRDNSNSNYSQFINTTDKVVLKDGCEAGDNNIHNIDLKLSGNNLHKADVYKTVIKFEAEQK